MEVYLTGREKSKDQGIVQGLPEIPDGADELVADLLVSRDTKYPPSVVCRNCEQQLSLQVLNQIDWRTDDRKFYIGPVPGYECQPCGESYFPRNVVTRVIECINQEIEKLNLGSPIPTLPLSKTINVI